MLLLLILTRETFEKNIKGKHIQNNTFVNWNFNKTNQILYTYCDGRMNDYTAIKSSPWSNESFISVVFIGEITTIGNFSFSGCSHLQWGFQIFG